MATTGPDVLAVLVATDGAPWLADVLASLEAQTYPHLELIAVDNGSQDGSRDLLLARLSEERVLVAERDLGFGGAVSMALDADPTGDLVLLVHDDLFLEPDAVACLVDALTADPRLAAVGPKLRDWDHPDRLQQVGWTVDLTGRADMGIEPDERDQGQRDRARRTLVVSTAGMLIRRDVFEAIGRFDRRYHVFRDDLDVCWRAWLAGWEIEVAPAAAGRHVRAAAEYHRLGHSAFLGARYFAERNTLASLIKNYGASRLAYVLPLFLIVGLAKTLGFVATRQVGAAWQTVRAWGWNLRHLPTTLELRHQTQALRRRSDKELRQRFARISPRLRAYGEAIADRLTGGDLRVGASGSSSSDEPGTVTARVRGALQRHPLGWSVLGLAIVGLVAVFPLLPPGSLRGGSLAPFPSGSTVFLEDYTASWHDVGAVGTAAAPSPAQALLGLLQFVSFGGSYLASRLLILGAVPFAWLLTLRAIRPLTPARVPRLAAATLYVLSPTSLAAVRTGRVGALVVLVGLPAFASAVVAALRRDGPSASNWRAAAAAVLVGGAMIAFEPVTALGVVGVYAAATGWIAVRATDLRTRRRSAARIAIMLAGTFAVLFPWSLSLLRMDGPLTEGLSRAGADAAPFWRWLLQAPDAVGFAGTVAGAGAVVAGVLVLMLAARRRPAVIMLLWTAAILGALLATATSRAGTAAWTWPGVPLLLTSASLAALLAVGLQSLPQLLATRDIGWHQIGAATMVGAAVLGCAVAFSGIVRDGWTGYVVDEPALPAFIVSAAAEAPDMRVLTVADTSGAVRWDVAPATGATMASFGTPAPNGFVRTVDDVIRAVVGEQNAGAGGRLGLLNIGFVVVPEGGRSDRLAQALAQQLDLEPRPVAAGLVYRVSAFTPRVAWVPTATIRAIRRRGTPPAELDARGFDRVGAATFRGVVPGEGAILISETEVDGWSATTAAGRHLPAVSTAGLVSVDVPADAGVVTVTHGGQGRRSALVVAQALAVLLTLSMMLRPPSFALEERD